MESEWYRSQLIMSTINKSRNSRVSIMLKNMEVNTRKKWKSWKYLPFKLALGWGKSVLGEIKKGGDDHFKKLANSLFDSERQYFGVIWKILWQKGPSCFVQAEFSSTTAHLCHPNLSVWEPTLGVSPGRAEMGEPAQAPDGMSELRKGLVKMSILWQEWSRGWRSGDVCLTMIFICCWNKWASHNGLHWQH